MLAITRRSFGTTLVGAGLAVAARPALAEVPMPADPDSYYGAQAEDHGKVYRATNMDKIDRVWRRQLVRYPSDEPQGTVVVDTRNHFLYVIFENGTALRYGVGVGREGFQWFGRATINRRAMWPDWTPPPEMIKRRPDLPRFMAGGPDNPMGARGLYLYRDGRDLGYRLHGTNEPWSIGGDGSSGCIRMLTEDIMDLYGRCPIGTKVLVLRHLGSRDAT
jgi:lipoprotein-anchoring transpeptidase ErfK/SrfK